VRVDKQEHSWDTKWFAIRANHSTKTDDRRIHDWLRLKFQKGLSQEKALDRLHSLLSHYAVLAHEHNLKQIEIGLPFAWRTVAEEIEAMGFRKGLLYVEASARSAKTIPSDPTLCKIEKRDVPAILPLVYEQQRLHNRLDPDFFARPADVDIFGYVDEMLQMIGTGECVAYCLRSKNRFAGFASAVRNMPHYWDDKSRSYVQEIFVAKREREKGNGTKLMSALMRHAPYGANRSRRIWTSLAARNEVAWRFYKSLGFKPTLIWYYLNAGDADLF
jgi:ribosomal protein S18 acetylase RimI-like enzyme